MKYFFTHTCLCVTHEQYQWQIMSDIKILRNSQGTWFVEININYTLIKKSSNDKTMRKLCIIEKIWYYIRFNNNYSIIQTIFKITTSCIIMNKPPWQVRCTNIARDKIKENIFCVIFELAWSSARLQLSTINIYLNNYTIFGLQMAGF